MHALPARKRKSDGKTANRSQGAPKQLTSTVGRLILPLHDACQYFDQVTSVARQSPYCNTRRRINEEDEQIMLDVCLTANVFQEFPPQQFDGRPVAMVSVFFYMRVILSFHYC
jgi:hypothetical protein